MSLATSSAQTREPRVISVRPWPDPVIDRLGVDPRAAYVERFWLAQLGPSATLLARRLADGFDACPDGFELDLAVTGRALGLGHGVDRNSPVQRALTRLCRFGLAAKIDSTEVMVRRRLPPLTRRQLHRLPEAIRGEHEAWRDAGAVPASAPRQPSPPGPGGDVAHLAPPDPPAVTLPPPPAA